MICIMAAHTRELPNSVLEAIARNYAANGGWVIRTAVVEC